jgi:hypothetical protein
MGDEMVRQQMTKNKKTAAETKVISPNYQICKGSWSPTTLTTMIITKPNMSLSVTVERKKGSTLMITHHLL